MHELHGRTLCSVDWILVHGLCCGNLLHRDGGDIIVDVRELLGGNSPIERANFVHILCSRLLCRVHRVHVLRSLPSRLVFRFARIDELHELRRGVFRE